jgi:methyl-accepting chemotaxis protein
MFSVRKLLGKSIGFKFFAVISVILLISTIVSSVLIARYQRALLRQSLEEKGNSLISYIAKLSKDPLVMKDSILLDGIVHELNRDAEVMYAVISDSSGNILTSRFSSFNSQIPGVKTITAELPRDSELQDIIAAIKKAGGVVELAVPILVDSETIGKATIGMSDHKIVQQVTKTVLFILSVNLVTALLLGAALFIASRKIIVNPVVRLTAVSQRLAAGDLSQSINVKTSDEIGQLGHTTDMMISDLKELIGKIRETASKTTSAAEKIVTGSRQVKQGTLTTAQAAEGTLTSMEEMASSIKSVSENAESLSANVEQTSSSITEMMALVESAAANLAELTSSVTETSSTVEEMTVSIEHVAKEAEDLSRVVYNAAASVEQMAKAVEQVDKHVQDAGALSQRSVEEAKVGGEALSQSFKAMKSISGTMSSIATLIQSLEMSSREIGKILEVIEEIADQTNLLALNAAIQAAQAGDAGHGFAVVAKEVRELADRSRTAAKEISSVISRIQDETKDAVKSTESGAKESAAAMDMADRAAEALNKIVEAVEKTNRIMSMIMSTTTEQRAGSKEVLKYVNTMRVSSDQVKRAMTEQATGGRQIRLAVEGMNRIMREASKGASEQAVGSKQIIMAVENMNQMTRQVTIATAEQKQGGDLVVKSTENISHIAKENLKAAEQMAQSSEELVAEANSLLENVARFKL